MLLALVLSCDSKFQRVIMSCVLRKEKKKSFYLVYFFLVAFAS